MKEFDEDETVADADYEWHAYIRSVHGSQLDEKMTMFLLPGRYTVITQYDPGTPEGTTGKFHIELD